MQSILGEIAHETQYGIFDTIFSFLENRKHGWTHSLTIHIRKNNDLGCLYISARAGNRVRRHRLRKAHWQVQFDPFSVEFDFRHHLTRSILCAPDSETRKSLESFQGIWMNMQDWQLSIPHLVYRPFTVCRRIRRRYGPATVLDLLLD